MDRRKKKFSKHRLLDVLSFLKRFVVICRRRSSLFVCHAYARSKKRSEFGDNWFRNDGTWATIGTMSEVSKIIQAIQNGDKAASEQLLPLVYDELRRLAYSRMSQESPGQTLQPTALVHEAYMRLVDSKDQQAWNSRGHFFGAAANAMRRILIENARRKNTLRRGGDWRRFSLEKMDVVDSDNDDFLIALDGFLSQLAENNEIVARVVNLRYFGGLSVEETSKSLEISVRTVNRHWAFAKAWLYSKMSEEFEPLDR